MNTEQNDIKKEPWHERKGIMVPLSLIFPYIAAPIMWVKKSYDIKIRLIVTVWAIILISTQINIPGSIQGEYIYNNTEAGVAAIIRIDASDCIYALSSGGFKTSARGSYKYDKNNGKIYFAWSNAIAPKVADVIKLQNGSIRLQLSTGAVYNKK